jgi:hypothetical protein
LKMEKCKQDLEFGWAKTYFLEQMV